jgi:regulator of RNase E activity RraA
MQVLAHMKSTEVPLTPEQLEALRRLDACTIANAIETFQKRLRNEGFVDHTIRAIFPRLQPMVGFAATVRIRGSAPPTASGIYPDRSDWWDYILSVPAPRVIVVQDCATRPGVGSLLGAVHTNIMKALGCAGAVTNGSVRDIPALGSLAFPVFAGSVGVSHAYVHIVEMGKAVEIGGLNIKSGDLLHGDVHGVQCIPIDIAAKVPAVASKITQREEEIIAVCRSAEFSLEKLRTLFSRSPL